jgi:hypothetical protein
MRLNAISFTTASISLTSASNKPTIGDIIKTLASPASYPIRLALHELAMLVWEGPRNGSPSVSGLKSSSQ